MQRVSVSVQFPQGGTFYKTELCTRQHTIMQIVEECDLPQPGIRVYLNGDYVPQRDLQKPLSSFKVGNPAFLSVKYFIDKKRVDAGQ